MTELTTILGEKLLNSNNDKINTNELKDKTVGLYFSAQWCHRCQNLTSKLTKAYNDALKENNNLLFDIVFISADNDQEEFDEYYENMPWKAIPFQNRDQVEKLYEYYQIQDIPTLIIIKTDGDILTLEGDEEFESINTIKRWANGQTKYWKREPQNNDENVWIDVICNNCSMNPLVGIRFGCIDRECGYDLCHDCYSKQNIHRHHHELIEFWSPRKIYSIEQMFDQSDLLNKNNKCITIESLKNKYIGLYFSACWSDPSYSFTSDLAEIYLIAIQTNLPFDIIFISADDNQLNFDKQYETMPWKALPFHNHLIKLHLKTYFSVNIIPTLIILKPNGELFTKSGKKHIERKGIEAIQSWCKGEKIKIIPTDFVWSSISCDGCDMTPLIGQRFYCETCSNYDLCLACKEKGHEHELLLIPQPNDYEDVDD